MSAHDVLKEFLTSWIAQAWSEMALRCQKTWIEHQHTYAKVAVKEEAPAVMLRYFFEVIELTAFDIGEPTRETECLIDIPVRAAVSVGGQGAVRHLLVRLIKEVAPYKPSPEGDWGVNPSSALREWTPRSEPIVTDIPNPERRVDDGEHEGGR